MRDHVRDFDQADDRAQDQILLRRGRDAGRQLVTRLDPRGVNGKLAAVGSGPRAGSTPQRVDVSSDFIARRGLPAAYSIPISLPFMIWAKLRVPLTLLWSSLKVKVSTR